MSGQDVPAVGFQELFQTPFGMSIHTDICGAGHTLEMA